MFESCEVEEVVVGVMFLSCEVIFDVVEILIEEDFVML